MLELNTVIYGTSWVISTRLKYWIKVLDNITRYHYFEGGYTRV